MLRVAGLGLMAIGVVAACASSVRPSYRPFPQARVDTVNATPVQAIQELSDAIAGETIRVRWSSPEEGYIETMWYNVVTRESGVTDMSNPELIIKLRFWADPIGTDRARVTGEAATWRTTDRSVVIERDREMMVAPGHVGDQILRRVMQRLEERYGG